MDPHQPNPARQPTAQTVTQPTTTHAWPTPDLGVLIWIAIITGARRDEFCALRWTDFHARPPHPNTSCGASPKTDDASSRKTPKATNAATSPATPPQSGKVGSSRRVGAGFHRTPAVRGRVGLERLDSQLDLADRARNAHPIEVYSHYGDDQIELLLKGKTLARQTAGSGSDMPLVTILETEYQRAN